MTASATARARVALTVQLADGDPIEFCSVDDVAFPVSVDLAGPSSPGEPAHATVALDQASVVAALATAARTIADNLIPLDAAAAR